MKLFTKLCLTLALGLLVLAAEAQNNKRLLQYFRPQGQMGLNVFEPSKIDTSEFENLYLVVGGDFSIIFQGLDQENDLVGDTLVTLANNFALPTANLNLDVQIANGVRMHLRTYLSSRNHPEAWVKGGYFQIDELDFIQEGLLSEFMEIARLRFGMDEINYGDAHFRRSDNARSIYNPFVGNYIMDAFTTEPFAELSLFPGNFLVVAGVSNGRLNQSPVEGDNGLAFYAKLGYDNQMSGMVADMPRFRLTGSVYHSTDGSTRDYLYNGDRAGARYYSVLEGVNDARVSNFEPRFNPGFSSQTAVQINPFLKFGGLEFFGIAEFASNGDDAVGGDFTHFAGELIYRFGGADQLYVATRYNQVEGERADGAPTLEIDRFHVGGGWYLTKNVMAKAEYVTSSYEGAGWDETKYQGAEFNGIVLEAVIGF